MLLAKMWGFYSQNIISLMRISSHSSITAIILITISLHLYSVQQFNTTPISQVSLQKPLSTEQPPLGPCHTFKPHRHHTAGWACFPDPSTEACSMALARVDLRLPQQCVATVASALSLRLISRGGSKLLLR